MTYFIEKTTVTNNEEKKEETNVESTTVANKKDEVKNPKTGVLDLTVVLIIIIALTYFSYKYNKNGKFFKRVSLFIIVLLPISTLAINVGDIKTTKDIIDNIRDYLIKNGGKTKNNNYDYDNDNYVTINDLVYADINYYTPKITIKNVNSVKGSTSDNVNIYSKLTKNIVVDSPSNVYSIVYCISDKENCEPDTYLCGSNSYYLKEELNALKVPTDVANCNNVELSINDTETKKTVCVRTVNKNGLVSKKCDGENFIVDSKKPIITAKNVNVTSLDEVKQYDAKKNVSVEYGVSGGTISCSENLDEEHQLKTVKCTAKGNNGLVSDETSFTISTSPTAGRNIIFFGDSIISGDCVPSVDGKNGFDIAFTKYDFNLVANAGSSGCTIRNDDCLKKSINNKVTNYDNINFDIVVIEGGINDAIKDYNDRSDDTKKRDGVAYNQDTFKTAAKKYIARAYELYPNAKFVFLKTYGIKSYNGVVYYGNEAYGNAGYDVMMNYQSLLYSAFTSVIPAEQRMSFDMNKYFSYLHSGRLRDGLHLDGAAYAHIGTELYNAILNELKK